MTKTDWTPDSQPADEADPLSATGMFLSALGKESEQPRKQPEQSLADPVARPEAKQAAWPAEPAFTSSPYASPAAPQGAPGEFTKLFQAGQSARAVPQPLAAAHAPVPSIEPKQAVASAPGEFTRIFVKQAEGKAADRVPVPPVRSIPDAPPAAPPAPGSPRLKGFSSGASDSASVEGGFTQFFQPRPATAAPTPRVEPYSPPVSGPATPAEEIKWPRQSDFSASEAPVSPGTGSTSVTSLFASLASTEQRQEPVRQESFRQEQFKAAPVEPPPSYTPAPLPPYSPAPSPSFSSAPLPPYSPAPPAEPSAPEAGSVTRLIQRLSEGAKPAPLVEPSPTAAAPPPPAVDSGPGEFTRMISTSTLRTTAGAPPPAPAPAAAAPAFAPPPIPKPAISMPPMPAAAPPAMAAPKFEPPKAPAPPKLALPPAPAPAGKFQEMVPILLVVNTFLLLVLIVLVIFELKGK